MADSTDSNPEWHELYKAALFETDPSNIASRIAEARQALVLRSREIFSTSFRDDGETEAIEDALYALQALENCLKLNVSDRRRTARAS